MRVNELKSRVVVASLFAAACGAGPELEAEAEPSQQLLPRFGFVALESHFASSAQSTQAFADAFFWQAATEGSTGCAVIDTIGACQISECLRSEAVAPEPGFAWLSGLAVDILGAKLGFSFTETQPGLYSPSLPTRSLTLWEGGETLTAVVRGSNEFPTTTVTLTAPPRVELTAPALASEGFTVDPALDLDFAWTSPTEDIVYVDIEERRAGPVRPRSERSARCSFPASLGKNSISAGVFAALPAPELLAGYRFHVFTTAETKVSSDEATFTFSSSAQSFNTLATLHTETE